MKQTPANEELHALIDGELDPARCNEIQAWLADTPRMAAMVAGWRQDAARLRAAAGPADGRPIETRLEPGVIRARLRARRVRRGTMAAALMLALGLGGASGWIAREWTFLDASPPMADAMQAYRMFADAEPGTVSLPGAPDLTAYGLHLADTRRMATGNGAAMLWIYADPEGHPVIFYRRPASALYRKMDGARREDGLLAQYWSHDGFNFAIVSLATDNRAPALRNILQPAS